MQLVMGGINGDYLQNIMLNKAAITETDKVQAAVAYATDARLLFDWCWDNSIPLEYYGRLDDSVAVTTRILESFLKPRSAPSECYLVEHHHAKVIWWRGYGLYIGSANLTTKAWNNNVEAGCFIPEAEIDDDTASDIDQLFALLRDHSTELTDELLALMDKRATQLSKSKPSSAEFWNSPCLVRWPGLVTTEKKKASQRRHEAFRKEWYDTLQILRRIAEQVSLPENRPSWVNPDVPAGAQADQLLHAHYYQRVIEGRRSLHHTRFEEHRHNPEAALKEAINWWQGLPQAPSKEDVMLNDTAPRLRTVLAENAIDRMNYDIFQEICMGVHAIKGYAWRVPDKAVGLREGGENGNGYSIPQKVDALSKYIWDGRSAGGHTVKELLQFVLYGGKDGGKDDELPDRLWRAVYDETWKIDRLGLSGLGELVGWALPDRFPPRNGRTSKSLRSLGYNVKVHGE